MTVLRAVWLKLPRPRTVGVFTANFFTIMLLLALALALVMTLVTVPLALFLSHAMLKDIPLPVLTVSLGFSTFITLCAVSEWSKRDLLLLHLTPFKLRQARRRHARAAALAQAGMSEEKLREREQLREEFLRVGEALAENQGQGPLAATVTAHELMAVLDGRTSK